MSHPVRESAPRAASSVRDTDGSPEVPPREVDSSAAVEDDDRVAHAAAEDRHRALRVPVRTIPLLIMFVLVGAVILVFTLMTVNDRPAEALRSNAMAQRSHFSIEFWMQHGLLNSGGVTARASDDDSVRFHRSSTGGRLIGGYLVERTYKTVTGRYSWRLLAVYNQIVVLVLASLLALLAFRLAARGGTPPLHALALALAFQMVFFTFPDNLALYWGASGREYWLLFATIFLLIEERSAERRTRASIGLQALSVFLLAYMELVAGIAFVVSYGIATVILETDGSALKRLCLACAVPALLALALHRGLLLHVSAMFPDIPQEGSSFLFRSGLDGSTTYYRDHLDIALARETARRNFPPNGALLFDWMWIFLAGSSALVGVLAAASRGRVGRPGVITLASLIGAYLLTAALFSQSVVIHPYLYDVMIFTPLVLVLFAMLPSLIEPSVRFRGTLVIVVVLLAAWVSMLQMRQYVLQYPFPPPGPSAESGSMTELWIPRDLASRHRATPARG